MGSPSFVMSYGPVSQSNTEGCKSLNQTPRSTNNACVMFDAQRKAKEFEDASLKIFLRGCLLDNLANMDSIVWFGNS